MAVKNQLKKIIERVNPLEITRRKKMRNQLVNRDITFLTPNCIGGILFHDLGLRFNSPTVNTMMTQSDFLQFVLNLDDYLHSELKFFKNPEDGCPCALLCGGGRRLQ